MTVASDVAGLRFLLWRWEMPSPPLRLRLAELYHGRSNKAQVTFTRRRCVIRLRFKLLLLL
jgi:hypothetical protein